METALSRALAIISGDTQRQSEIPETNLPSLMLFLSRSFDHNDAKVPIRSTKANLEI